jgi:hypothetical protein
VSKVQHVNTNTFAVKQHRKQKLTLRSDGRSWHQESRSAMSIWSALDLSKPVTGSALTEEMQNLCDEVAQVHNERAAVAVPMKERHHDSVRRRLTEPPGRHFVEVRA